MKVRLKDFPEAVGSSMDFNTHALAEVIVGFEGHGQDSVSVLDLEVWIEGLGWKDMSRAFRDRDLIPDNHNRWFGEPRTCEDIERGYFK